MLLLLMSGQSNQQESQNPGEQSGESANTDRIPEKRPETIAASKSSRDKRFSSA